VEAGRDTDALEWLLALETRADEPEDRHILRRPLDARLAVWGEAQVFDVTLDATWGYSRHIGSTPLLGTFRQVVYNRNQQ
jgi:hypothetical protein